MGPWQLMPWTARQLARRGPLSGALPARAATLAVRYATQRGIAEKTLDYASAFALYYFWGHGPAAHSRPASKPLALMHRVLLLKRLYLREVQFR
jgi:hypothetical protein